MSSDFEPVPIAPRLLLQTKEPDYRRPRYHQNVGWQANTVLWVEMECVVYTQPSGTEPLHFLRAILLPKLTEQMSNSERPLVHDCIGLREFDARTKVRRIACMQADYLYATPQTQRVRWHNRDQSFGHHQVHD